MRSALAAPSSHMEGFVSTPLYYRRDLWGRIVSCWPVSNRPLRAEQPRPGSGRGAIRSKTKEGLEESFHRSLGLLDQINAGSKRQATQLLGILSENPGLKAGIGLLRETHLDPSARLQIRRTI